jgi:hypothetical protein
MVGTISNPNFSEYFYVYWNYPCFKKTFVKQRKMQFEKQNDNKLFNLTNNETMNDVFLQYVRIF